MPFVIVFVPAFILIVAGLSVTIASIMRRIISGGFTELKRFGRKELLLIGPYTMFWIAGILLCKSIELTLSVREIIYFSFAMILIICASIIRISVRLANAKNTRNETVRKERLQERQSKLLSFCEECIRNGIRSCKSEKEKQKMILIAEKNELTYTNIEALFNEAMKYYQSKSKADEEQRLKKWLAKLKEEEQVQFNVLNEFSSYPAREKRIAMLTKERNELSRELRATEDAIEMTVSPPLQKGSDWAVLGGIANGLSGVGAGIATALNTQIENAKIEAQNDYLLHETADIRAKLFIAGLNQKDSLKNKIGLLNDEIDATTVKLIGKETPAECLKALHFSKTDISISESGTCTVETEVGLKQSEYHIFKDVKATIDGTIQAEIYDGNNKIGTANLVLPLNGVPDGNMVAVKGMCLFCGQPGKHYSVKFNAENLWAMEQ